MELRVLRYFLVVAREENITKAAARLHITQPTLSRQLGQLEQELGAALFYRKNHRIVLTEDGMLLKRRAQELLELADKTRREFSGQGELSGEVAIGCGETRSMACLSDMMVSFRELYPPVRFRIHSATADEVKERLHSGLLDIGLLVEPVDAPGLQCRPMPCRERWAVLVPKDSPLALLPAVSPEDLLPYPIILSSRDEVNEQLAGWFGDLFERARIAARCNFFLNAAIMVKHGVGVALRHDLGTAGYESLRLVPLAMAPESGAVLAWKKDQPRSRAVEQFIAHIKSPGAVRPEG